MGAHSPENLAAIAIISERRGTMEKLIYVHVARLGDSLDRKRVCSQGAMMQQTIDFALKDTDCVVVRSRLYVIGGCCMMCHSGSYDCERQISPKTSPTCFQELGSSSFAVDDDGILYIYLCLNLRLITFDIRNKKELHAVDLPKSFWFGLDDRVQLMVLSKNKFCLLWDRVGTSMNKRRIYYSRFSVSYDDLPYSTLDVEETRSFLVVGYRVLNAVTVTMNTDECIGAYVKRGIGSGAHGNVYVAQHRKTRAICGAVKELNIYKADAFEYIRKPTGKTSKHCTLYYGHKEEGGRISLYMEYIQPGSLKKYISESKRGKLDGPLIQNFTAQILSGLVHLHSNKLVHGDLKPDNLLVDSKNIVKLVDFGLAKLLAKSVGKHSVGELHLMQPQRFFIEKNIESDSDSDSDSVFVVKQHPEIPRALCQDGKDFLNLCFKIRPPKRPSAEELLKHPFVCKSTS
ncbi:hypothetical protein K1719_041310 [Acacia pycnantha]|nr:hypothetical protein K1719_041310 [Acacia pycnantha]